MVQWHHGTVVENHRCTERLTALKIDTQLGDFEAGQFVRVGLEIGEEVLARPYSLVNAPTESLLEIYFNIVPQGPLSPRLFALEAGDTVLVAPRPAGFLTISEVPQAEYLWMMATGTGIGPFLSILKSETVWQRFKRVILCYSVRTVEELAYVQLIKKLAEIRSDQFCFIPHVTREEAPGALRIRIPVGIGSGDLERRANAPLTADSSHVMMCGSADMIKEVSALLESRSMRRHRRREAGHYTTEKYH